MTELPIGEVLQGDCLEIMRGWPTGCIDAVITDPPYGQKVCSDGTHAGTYTDVSKRYNGFIGHRVYPVVEWDSVRPSIHHFTELIRVSKIQAIFGGNFFADVLPPSRCWYVWNKVRRGLDNADGELVWTSLDAPMRIMDYHTNAMTANRQTEPRVHPTQKPVQIMERLIKDLTDPGALILDPFCGSGSTLTAAERLGRRWIGIDISADYCAIARKRTAQKGLALEVQE